MQGPDPIQAGKELRRNNATRSPPSMPGCKHLWNLWTTQRHTKKVSIAVSASSHIPEHSQNCVNVKAELYPNRCRFRVVTRS